MREKLKNITQNKFVRNVTVLAAGTLLSQIVVVASSPLLARLFSVEDFGVLSLFTSVSVFFAVLSTGRYELAIGLPENDEKAKKVIQLVTLIGFFFSMFYLSVILLLKDVLTINDRTGFLNLSTSYLSPLYIFFVAIFSALGYWCQRFKQYKQITFANALQVISTAVLSIIYGLVGNSNGLIYSLIFGVVFSIGYLLFKNPDLLRIESRRETIKNVAKEYKYFPKYMIMSDLSLTASQQFVPIIFAALYSTSIVGFFAMANRVIRLPNILITSAIGNVFRNDAIDEIRKNGNCEDLYISTFKKLAAISIPIYIIIFLTVPYLFVLVFGEKWEMAGTFARILSVMLCVEFVALPLNTLFYIFEKQRLYMKLQVLNAVFSIILIYLGFYWLGSASYSLIFFTVNSILFNLVFLLSTYKISKNAA